MSSRSFGIVFICLTVLALSFTWEPAQAKEKREVIIFHAGSLTVPFAKMEKEFESLHPNIDVKREGGGSTKMARLISEVGKTADIMASADYKVIDNNLIPEFADWNIRFASNQLVLCYTDSSKYADEVNADNWYNILLREGVEWGHSDPNLDPCGYRSLMVMQLAEMYYNQDGLYQRLLENRNDKNVRPKSVELVNLLKTGNLDYAWEYLSVAVQHDLKYIKLNDHINLGNYKYSSMYEKTEVTVSGKKPGTTIVKEGKSCTYGVTMIKDAPNREAATKFLAYLLDPDKGLKILKDMGQPPFVPCRIPSKEMKDQLPQKLKSYVVVKQ
ncbi:MAG TPA: tungstate ABC transporter substrate-binding protein WtpA [Desulfohalobiaceae bacterium]|nr:tungstate ABC transporter substrate-binding protein WtpA [Desulfohalobiaceae bacterium]